MRCPERDSYHPPLPIGIIIGSLVPNAQKVGTWGMLPIMVLAGISGIFFPVQQLWGRVQVTAPVFPMSRLGLGMRSSSSRVRTRWRRRRGGSVSASATARFSAS